jgi:hypothetical protein
MHYAPGFRKTGIRTPEFLGTGLLDTTDVADVVPVVAAPGFFTFGIRFESDVTGLSSTMVPSPPTEKP